MRVKALAAAVAVIASVGTLALTPPAYAGKAVAKTTASVFNRTACSLEATFTWSSAPAGAVYVRTDGYRDDGSTASYTSGDQLIASSPSPFENVFRAAPDALQHTYVFKSYFEDASLVPLDTTTYDSRSLKFACRANAV